MITTVVGIWTIAVVFMIIGCQRITAYNDWPYELLLIMIPAMALWAFFCFKWVL